MVGGNEAHNNEHACGLTHLVHYTLRRVVAYHVGQEVAASAGRPLLQHMVHNSAECRVVYVAERCAENVARSIGEYVAVGTHESLSLVEFLGQCLLVLFHYGGAKPLVANSVGLDGVAQLSTSLGNGAKGAMHGVVQQHHLLVPQIPAYAHADHDEAEGGENHENYYWRQHSDAQTLESNLHCCSDALLFSGFL